MFNAKPITINLLQHSSGRQRLCVEIKWQTSSRGERVAAKQGHRNDVKTLGLIMLINLFKWFELIEKAVLGQSRSINERTEKFPCTMRSYK